MEIGIKHIEYYYPENILNNNHFTDLKVDPGFLENRIGIKRRYIADKNTSTVDMALMAAEQLFYKNNLLKEEIDVLIFCTQTPDYRIPHCSSIFQHSFNLKKSILAFDINLGCSAFVYALFLSKVILQSSNLNKCLIINAEQYSKYISYKDRTVATIFSDAATATLVEKFNTNSSIGETNFGTDGSGAKNLIIPASGTKLLPNESSKILKKYTEGTERTLENLFMDGFEISKFVFKEIPPSINELLEISMLEIDSIDLFVFHQANKYLIESLSQRMKINLEKVYINLENGNTVSCSIPIALKDISKNGTILSKLPNNLTILLSGFGVGYSWANMLIKTNIKFFNEL